MWAYMAAGEAPGALRLGDHNDLELAGVAPNSLNIKNRRRVTAADAYLITNVLNRTNLALLMRYEAEHLTFMGQRASGVTAVHKGEIVTIQGDQIVLSAGAIATFLLLMRSGIGDRATLATAEIACRHALPGMGCNLQDHMLALGNLYAAKKPVPPSRLQHSESQMHLHSGDITRAKGAPDIVLACVVAPSVSDQFTAPPYGTAFTILTGMTHPPVIDPRYLETEHDRITFRKALAIAR